MALKTFDFAVLGDLQPEGLLVAAGLVRRGYSVIIVPSSELGEKGPRDDTHWAFPVKVDKRPTTDLLFKAGFFRIEDAYLVSEKAQWQFILPKHRMSFDGTLQQYLTETEREFPHLWSALMDIAQLKRQMHTPSLRRTLKNLTEIFMRDSTVHRWVDLEMNWLLRPNAELSLTEKVKVWVHKLLFTDDRIYKVDRTLATSYPQFLQENARKWGAETLQDGLQFKNAWNGYQLSSDIRATHLLINGLGAGRLLAKQGQGKAQAPVKAWLFTEDLKLATYWIPEPFSEQIFCGDRVDNSFEMTISRDASPGLSHIRLGTWLSFEDSKSWQIKIQESRDKFAAILPFLPEGFWPRIPDMLELHETQGDLIKRGQFDRLEPFPKSMGPWDRLLSQWETKKPARMTRRVFFLNPYFLPYRNRTESIKNSLYLLDHFDRKQKKLANV